MMRIVAIFDEILGGSPRVRGHEVLSHASRVLTDCQFPRDTHSHFAYFLPVSTRSPSS